MLAPNALYKCAAKLRATRQIWSYLPQSQDRCHSALDLQENHGWAGYYSSKQL